MSTRIVCDLCGKQLAHHDPFHRIVVARAHDTPEGVCVPKPEMTRRLDVCRPCMEGLPPHPLNQKLTIAGAGPQRFLVAVPGSEHAV
jgi:hypothetical protein